VVERWNRTMKEKMFKYFSANSTRKYIDILDELELVKQANKQWLFSTFTWVSRWLLDNTFSG